MKILECVTKYYDNLHTVKEISLEVEENKITCLLGPSGCGKSTILNMIAGIITPTQGNVYIKDGHVGYVFQEDRLLPWKTVYENIAIVKDDIEHEKVMSIIKEVGLIGFEHSYPATLSGGMRQRVSIARALYYEPTLLLMDEPFKSLDYDLRMQMVEYLISLWEKEKSTILFVTHDIDEALLLANKIIVLTKRPTEISKEFIVEREQLRRDISDVELITLRSKIIKCLQERVLT